jgi:dihydrolipoamide dehydrogenase
LISAAEFMLRARSAHVMGIHVDGVRLDMAALNTWKSGIVDELSRGIDGLAKGRNVRRFLGRATLRGTNELIISQDGQTITLEFNQAVLAVGSRPLIPAPFQMTDHILSSDQALNLTVLPEKLLVVGGGYIGVELGTCFAALGSKVTLVEMLDRILPGTDAELVRNVRKRMDELGIRVVLEARATQLTEKDGKVEVRLEPKEGEALTESFDKVLVAIGRRPNTDNLGLEKAKLKVDERGFIVADNQCRTSVSNIFAIGDCTGQPALAHRARRQGIVAAEVIAGKPAAFDNRTVPAVIFADPEIAYCGMSEEEAKQAGHKVKLGRFRFGGSGRAKTLGQAEGLVLIVTDAESEVILGVRMVGPHVSELIGEATLAIETGAVLEDLISTIHAHPTLSEGLQEAAEAVRGHALHSVRTRHVGVGQK